MEVTQQRMEEAISSGHTWKVQVRFADGLDVRSERRCKDDPKLFGLSTQKYLY